MFEYTRMQWSRDVDVYPCEYVYMWAVCYCGLNMGQGLTLSFMAAFLGQVP